MPNIKGPIVFGQGKLPQAFTDTVAKAGVKLPFEAEGFKYSNSDLDKWLVIKKGGELQKYNRLTEAWVKVLAVSEEIIEEL